MAYGYGVPARAPVLLRTRDIPAAFFPLPSKKTSAPVSARIPPSQSCAYLLPFPVITHKGEIFLTRCTSSNQVRGN